MMNLLSRTQRQIYSTHTREISNVIITLVGFGPRAIRVANLPSEINK
jgi:hypothetical protein